MSYARGTTNYNLPQTQGSDKRDWADTNAAFLAVDTALKTANDNASSAGSAASTAQSTANSASTAASNAQSTANSAVSSATAAAELATTAKNRADSAYTLANTAKTRADDAYALAEANAQDIDELEDSVADSGWIVLNQSYNAYYRKIGKVVLVQCTLGTASITSGTPLTLGTLPTGIRPTYSITNAAVCGPSAAILGFINITPQGIVTIGQNSGTTQQYGQGSITFMI